MLTLSIAFPPKRNQLNYLFCTKKKPHTHSFFSHVNFLTWHKKRVSVRLACSNDTDQPKHFFDKCSCPCKISSRLVHFKLLIDPRNEGGSDQVQGAEHLLLCKQFSSALGYQAPRSKEGETRVKSAPNPILEKLKIVSKLSLDRWGCGCKILSRSHHFMAL